jgi:hypothetical protein
VLTERNKKTDLVQSLGGVSGCKVGFQLPPRQKKTTWTKNTVETPNGAKLLANFLLPTFTTASVTREKMVEPCHASLDSLLPNDYEFKHKLTSIAN